MFSLSMSFNELNTLAVLKSFLMNFGFSFFQHDFNYWVKPPRNSQPLATDDFSTSQTSVRGAQAERLEDYNEFWMQSKCVDTEWSMHTNQGLRVEN